MLSKNWETHKHFVFFQAISVKSDVFNWILKQNSWQCIVSIFYVLMKFKLFYSKSKSKTDLRSKHLADLMCVVNWLIIIYRFKTKFL